MRNIRIILSVTTTVLAVIVWFFARHVGTVPLSVYDFFPLLGLIAFSLMWSQIVSSAVNRAFQIKPQPHKRLNSVISGLILTLIVLHPLTVWIALFLDGAGLPPASYLSVYGVNGLAVTALLLGSLSLFIFLSYELHRWFSKKPWWRFVLWLQSLALAFIFFHALVLGREVGHSWFMIIWVVYGITLVAAWVYNYMQNKRKGDA